jgi:hypothetical protein
MIRLGTKKVRKILRQQAAELIGHDCFWGDDADKIAVNCCIVALAEATIPPKKLGRSFR